MFTISARSAGQAGDHLQIRALWPSARHLAGQPPHPIHASGGSLATVPLPVAVTEPADGFGLQRLRPGIPYTRGVPSPRLDAREWDLAFRNKLIAAIAQRRRRAYLSIGVAGASLVALTAGFVVLISWQTAERDVADRGKLETLAVHRATPATAARAAVVADVTADPSRWRRRESMLPVSTDEPDMPVALVATSAVSAQPASEAQAARSAVDPAERRIPLTIRGDALASGVMIIVRGLPDGVALVPGMSTSARTWVLGPEQSQSVHIVAPNSFRGTFAMAVDVIGERGGLLAQATARVDLPAPRIVVSLPTSAETPAAAKPLAQQHASREPGIVRPTNPARRTLGAAWSTVSTADPNARTPSEDSTVATEGGGTDRRLPAVQPAYGLGGPR